MIVELHETETEVRTKEDSESILEVGNHFSHVMHAQMTWDIPGGSELDSAHEGVSPLKFRLPYVGSGARIEEIYLQVGTAPGAAHLRVDIHKNGSSTMLTLEFVQVSTGETEGSRTTGFANDGIIEKDDYFQWELVQGDDSVTDLVIHLRYKWTLTSQ